MRVATVLGADGVRRLARLDQMDPDRAEALLEQAEVIHDLSGPEPVSEIAGVVHRRGRPDPKAESPKAKMRAEIAAQRPKPPKSPKGGRKKP